MKKRITQSQVAMVCGIDQGSVSRILGKDTRDLFSKETIEKVFRTARELGYLHPDLVISNRRDSGRRGLSATADIRLVVAVESLFATGTAEVENISLSGLLLRSIRTNNSLLPLEPYRIEVDVTSGGLAGFKAVGRPVRMDEQDGGLTIAVHFESLDPTNARTLKDYMAGPA
jgi:transcriptional regulator with XRE-family HTH domain